MIKKILFFILFSFLLAFPVLAQNQEEYVRAKVIDIIEEKEEMIIGDYLLTTQLIEARISRGENKGQLIIFENEGIKELDRLKKLEKNQKVVLLKHIQEDGVINYYLHDYDRGSSLIIVLIFFIALILYFGRKRGLGSILGQIGRAHV